MQQNWNPPTPIVQLLSQLKKGVDFAKAGGENVNEGQVVRIGYNLVAKTGLFEIACREWRMQNTIDKTLTNFRKHFLAADTDRTANTTTGNAGYHSPSANILQPTPTPMDAATQAAHIASLVTKQVELALAAMNTNHPSRQNRARVPRTPPPANPDGALSYCWIHGSSTNLSHDSLTCENPGTGHQTTATTTNKMGGSERIWSNADRRQRNRE